MLTTYAKLYILVLMITALQNKIIHLFLNTVSLTL